MLAVSSVSLISFVWMKTFIQKKVTIVSFVYTPHVTQIQIRFRFLYCHCNEYNEK